MNASEIIQYRLIKLTIGLLSHVPRRAIETVARYLGNLWYGLDRYHRKIALDNLAGAYGPEMGPDQRERTARATFVHLTRVALELPSLYKIDKTNVDRYITVKGTEHFREALDRKKGVLLLTAHLGNWEMMAVAGSLKFEISMNILARPLDHAPMDRLLHEIRTRTGNEVLDKNNSARTIAKKLRANKLVAILLDQNASWYDGVYVPFFGRTACTNKGLAIFALRYGVPVLPVFNIREKDGRYRIILESPVNIVRTGDLRKDIEENTAVFNQIIEKNIRMAPDNWLWVHRRWRLKNIPKG